MFRVEKVKGRKSKQYLLHAKHHCTHLVGIKSLHLHRHPEARTIIIPILQMSKLKHRLVQGHTVSKGWPPVSNLNYLDLESMLQTTILLSTEVALRGLDNHLSSDALPWP